MLELIEENEDSLEGAYVSESDAPEDTAIPDGARITVRIVRRYLGKGRGGSFAARVSGGDPLTVVAPKRPGERVGGGVRASMEYALRCVRVWPGDLVIARDGDAVVVGGIRIEPGQSARIFDESARARVLEDFIDDRSGEPKLGRRDLGEHTFRTRVTIRHLGVR